MQLPMLEWNGSFLYGTNSITRLLAKKYDLAGQGLYEQAQADNIINIIKDGGPIIINYFKGVYGVMNFDKVCIFFNAFIVL